MRKFSQILPTLTVLNAYKQDMAPTLNDINEDEWLALLGRYAESTIRYKNEAQFLAGFFTIMRESQERLRVKLRVNTILRNLDEERALSGESVLTNSATNPDTEPSTDTEEHLPFVNSQTFQKGKLSPVKGLYDWKHSVGGQAYNEFLDSFRALFKVILMEEETVYEQ